MLLQKSGKTSAYSGVRLNLKQEIMNETMAFYGGGNSHASDRTNNIDNTIIYDALVVSDGSLSIIFMVA